MVELRDIIAVGAGAVMMGAIGYSLCRYAKEKAPPSPVLAVLIPGATGLMFVAMAPPPTPLVRR